MTTANRGDTVRVHYTGRLDDGTVFDSSEGRDPIEFVVGAGTLIPGFESAVEGLTVGDKKTVVIGPEDAYGVRDDEKVVHIDRSRLPPDLDPEMGVVLQAETERGPVQVTIAGISGDTITLDANHPLAGKPLTFELVMMKIN